MSNTEADLQDTLPAPAAPLTEEQRHHNETLQTLLLNDDGDISEALESALLRIFARFSSSYRSSHPSIDALSPSESSLPKPSKTDVLTADDLDSFALATNGATLPEEAKEEIQEYLDTDDEGNLTFRGFCEMFHLQSDNEPEETWRDLGKCGFDDRLVFVGLKDGDQASKEEEVKKSGESATEKKSATTDEDEAAKSQGEAEQ